jgi:hypothetical protein
MNNDYFPFYAHYNRAMSLRESEPDMAIDILNQIRDEAIKSNQYHWRLLAEHWRVQVYISFKRDFVSASRFAIEAAVESRKPEYRNFREFVCVQNNLILVYEGIDPLGYADEIKEAIDLTIDQTNPQMSCHYCLNHRLMDYHLNNGELYKARDQAAKFFAITHAQLHYRIQAYEKLCYFSREDKAWSDLLELSRRGQEAASKNNDESSFIALKAYETLALQELGMYKEAEDAYQLQKLHAAGLKMVLSDDYFDTLVAYHEAQGKLEAALEIRKIHLEKFENAGRTYWECLARLDEIRLLRLLGRDIQAKSQTLRELAQQLKKPESIIELLGA